MGVDTFVMLKFCAEWYATNVIQHLKVRGCVRQQCIAVRSQSVRLP